MLRPLRRPAAAASLLLLTTTAGLAQQPPTRADCEAAHPSAWGKAGKDTETLNEFFAGYVRNMKPEEPRVGAHNAISPAFAERDPAGAFLYQQMNTFHTPPMGDVMKALTGERVAHADLDALGIPILMITGTDDDLFPAPLITESATMMTHATLLEIADAGHSAYFERPDAYNAALLEHLELR